MFCEMGGPTNGRDPSDSRFIQSESGQFEGYTAREAFLGAMRSSPTDSLCYQGFSQCPPQTARSDLNQDNKSPFPEANPEATPSQRKRKEDISKLESDFTDPDVLPPKPKRRTPEDRMAAKLRNFHITSHHHSSKHRPDAFFMKRPRETLEEIDSRLSEDEEDEFEEEDSDNFEPTIEVNPEFRKYLKAQRSSFSPWLKTPDSSMAVVLWQPSQNFVNGILEKSRIQEIPPELHNPENSPNGYCEADPIVTFPSSPSDEEVEKMGDSPDQSGMTSDSLQQTRISAGFQFQKPFFSNHNNTFDGIKIEEMPRRVGSFYSSSLSEDNDEYMEEL